MPLISLTTNVTKLNSDDSKKAFASNFSKFCAKTLGKEEKFLNVEVFFNPYLMFGGTFEPAIMLKIMSLYNTTSDNAKVWSKEFSTYFEKNLGVPIDRGLMAFTDPGPAFLGIRGSTMEALQAAPAE